MQRETGYDERGFVLINFTGEMALMHLDSEKIQMVIYEAGDAASQPLPVAFEEWEELARQKLAAGPFGYVFGAAGAGDTMKANARAFKKWVLLPRVCTDISKRNLTVSLFHQEIPIPFLMAPIGVNSIFHPGAELASAKAAAKTGVPYILSNVSSESMEDVAKAMGDSVRWFQIYPPKDHELTLSFLERAKASGYSAIVVTVDSPLLGWRETDLKNRYLPFLQGHGMGNYFSDPVFKSKLQEPPEVNLRTAVNLALLEGNNTVFTWDELEFIKRHTPLPVLLKGVTHPEDVRLALRHGIDGIVVSNHGGRQLDGAIATLDALPPILEVVNGRVPVLLDSGIRRGADAIKALALGADAVLLGRPYIYGLSVAGQHGVEEVLKNLIAQIELQLAICGCRSVRELNRSYILYLNEQTEIDPLFYQPSLAKPAQPEIPNLV